MEGQLVFLLKMALEFIHDLRWDIIITLILSIILNVVLMVKRKKHNRLLTNKKDIFQWEDFAFSVVTAATFYGGVSAIFFASTGNLLFNQNMIISEGYITLFAGLVLIGFAFSTYKNILKRIKRGRR